MAEGLDEGAAGDVGDGRRIVDAGAADGKGRCGVRHKASRYERTVTMERRSKSAGGGRCSARPDSQAGGRIPRAEPTRRLQRRATIPRAAGTGLDEPGPATGQAGSFFGRTIT